MLNEIFKGMDNAAEQIDQNFKQLEVESGSNDDGEWWRFSIGLQVCLGTRLGGALSPGNNVITWKYPKEFIGNPNVTGLPHAHTDNAYLINVGLNIDNPTVNSARIILRNTHTATTSGYVEPIAIGRWK